MNIYFDRQVLLGLLQEVLTLIYFDPILLSMFANTIQTYEQQG